MAAAALLLVACGDRAPTAPELPPPQDATYAVEGIVREVPPGESPGRPLQGVRVQVTTKRGLYATAVTGPEGFYRLEGLAGSFHIGAAHPGYEPNSIRIENLNGPRSVDLGLVPKEQTVTGVVLEAGTARNRTIAGARVTVTSGPNAGASAISDGRGRYSLRLMSGELDARVEHPGYGVTNARLRLDGLFSEVNMLMAAAPEVVRTLVNTTDRHMFTVQVHNPGELAIVDWSGYGFEEGDGYTLQIWEGGRLLVQAFAERSFPANTIVLRARVTPGKTYEVRTAESPLLGSRISVRHPL